MRLRRLDHLALAVEDLERAADAWAATFGLRTEPPQRPEGAQAGAVRLPLGGPDGAGASIDLAKSMEEGDYIARHIAERGEGMLSISVEVDDLDAAVRELREKGVSVSDPESDSSDGNRLARIDPASAFGVPVQLIERANP